MYRVFVLPQHTPGTLTLQASPEEWKRAAARLRQAGAEERLLARLIERSDLTTGPVVRLTFADAQGRRLLRALGLAS